VWALSEPEHFLRTVEILHERCMENLRRKLDNQTVDLYRICGPEYATPPYLPPEMFERCVVPYVKEMIDLIHARGAKARFHCHGRVGQVLEMIAATDADAIDPCEAPPDGDIELTDIKRRVGDRLCLFGNLQLKLLEHGSREQVAEAVRASFRAAKQGGGYVIMPTAAPINVPLAGKTEENYITFIETALEEGVYV
jgi:uroporphyrinogen-III decarboxylase